MCAATCLVLLLQRGCLSYVGCAHVNGLFTPGIISQNEYSLLHGKQDKINDNSLPIGKVQNLQLSLDSTVTIISPTFIGMPTAPTTANSNKTTQLATTEFVHNMIEDVIGGAPESLNTLKELSTALQNDANFLQQLITL